MSDRHANYGTLPGVQASNVVDLSAIAADAQNLCSSNLNKNTKKGYSDRLKLLVQKMLVLYPRSKFIVNGRLHPVRYYAPNTVSQEESNNVEQEMVEFTEQIINTVFHWWNNGKGDGMNLKDGTLQGMISCIGWALRSENLPKACTVPGKHYIEFPWKGSTLQKKLTNMYSGAKRKVGLARQQGLLSTKDGKLALTWAGIKMLATTFLLMGPDRSGKMEHAVATIADKMKESVGR